MPLYKQNMRELNFIKVKYLYYSFHTFAATIDK